MKIRRQKSNRSTAKQPRAGLMLLQTIIVITLGATILGLAITTMYGLMTVQRSFTDARVRAIAFARLNDDFRDIVGSSLSAELVPLEDEDSALKCQLPNQTTVTFQINGNAVALREDAPNSEPRVERYELADGTEFSWQLLSEPERVQLKILQTAFASETKSNKRPLIIESVVGRSLLSQKEQKQ